MKKLLNTPKAPKAVGPYSQGIESNGTYYFSGQIGLIPESGEMQNSFEGQLSQIFKNIDALLEGAGLKRDNVVKSTVFLTDLGKFAQMNAEYEKFFNTPPFPARSTIQVSALPKGGQVEIEIIATK